MYHYCLTVIYLLKDWNLEEVCMAVQRAPSRDTMTTCNPELYENKFTLDIRRSEFKISSTQPGSKDTIERSLSKEALDRLQQPSKDTIVQSSYLFRRIGKYVFLAAALPPYFILYGLPKWLLVEALPTLMSALASVTNNVQQKLLKPFNVVVQKLNQVLIFIQMISKRILMPVAKLAIEVRQFFQRFNVRTRQFFGNMAQNVKNVFKGPGELASNLMARIKNRWSASSQWIAEKAMVAHKRVQEGINWVKQSPHLLMEWGTAQVQRMVSTQANWKRKMSPTFQGSKNAAAACSGWVGKQLGSAKKLVTWGFSPIVKLYQEALKPLFNFFKKSISDGMNKMSDFFNNRKKRVLGYLQGAQERIKSWTPQEAIERLFSKSFLSKLPALLRNFLIKVKQNSVFQLLFRMGFRLVKFVLLQSTKVSQLAVEGISFLVNKVSQVYNQASAQIKKIFTKLLFTVDSCIVYARELSKKGFYGSLVLLIMGGYLVLWGFEWLGEITTRYLSNLTLKPTKTN